MVRSRLGHLVSVEQDAGWYREVTAQLSVAGVTNVDYRYVPFDHPTAQAEQPAYDRRPRYVATIADAPDGSLDFVVVDGARIPVLAGPEKVHESTNGIKRTGVRNKPVAGGAARG